jgi:hypothetical protein
MGDKFTASKTILNGSLSTIDRPSIKSWFLVEGKKKGGERGVGRQTGKDTYPFTILNTTIYHQTPK